MPTIVNLPSDFVNLDTLIRSISRAVTGIDWEPPQKLPDGSINIEAFKLAAAGVDWATRIIELAKKGVLTARNPQSLQSEKWSFLDPEEAFFSIGDLNTCDRLKDGILEFVVAPVGPRPKEPGFYTLEDAAQAISTNLGWHEGARDTLKKQLMDAARTEKLTVRHPHTDAPYRPDTVRDFYELVTPDDVNKWAAAGGMSWRWEVSTPKPQAPPVVAEIETKVQRQDRRLKACIDAGLPMNEKAALIRLPDGVGDVADREGVTRQSFSIDVKAALKRRENAKREGHIVRQM